MMNWDQLVCKNSGWPVRRPSAWTPAKFFASADSTQAFIRLIMIATQHIRNNNYYSVLTSSRSVHSLITMASVCLFNDVEGRLWIGESLFNEVVLDYHNFNSWPHASHLQANLKWFVAYPLISCTCAWAFGRTLSKIQAKLLSCIDGEFTRPLSTAC